PTVTSLQGAQRRLEEECRVRTRMSDDVEEQQAVEPRHHRVADLIARQRRRPRVLTQRQACRRRWERDRPDIRRRPGTHWPWRTRGELRLLARAREATPGNAGGDAA